MKRSEIIAEGKAIKEATAEARRALDRIDARVDALIAGLSAPEPVAVPTQIEYDRERLPTPPVPVQPAAKAEAPGEYLELDMESLHVTDDGERKTFKVKGGAYRKWGVFIWPEVLEGDFGINAEAIKPGLHPFKYRVRILMDGDKPRKVVGLAQ